MSEFEQDLGSKSNQQSEYPGLTFSQTQALIAQHKDGPRPLDGPGSQSHTTGQLNIEPRSEQDIVTAPRTSLAELLRDEGPKLPNSIEGLWSAPLYSFAHKNPDGSISYMTIVDYPFDSQALFDILNTIALVPKERREDDRSDIELKRIIAGDWILLTTGTGREPEKEEYLLKLHRVNLPFDRFAPHVRGFLRAILQEVTLADAVEYNVLAFKEKNPEFWRTMHETFAEFYKRAVRMTTHKRTAGKPYESALYALKDRQAEFATLYAEVVSGTRDAAKIEDFLKTFGFEYRVILDLFMKRRSLFPNDPPIIKGQTRIESIGNGQVKVTVGRNLIGIAEFEQSTPWYWRMFVKEVSAASNLYPVLTLTVKPSGKRLYDMRFLHQGPFKKVYKRFRTMHSLPEGMSFRPQTYDTLLGWMVIALASPEVREHWNSYMRLIKPPEYRNPHRSYQPSMTIGPAQVVLHPFLFEESLVQTKVIQKVLDHIQTHGQVE